MNKLHMVLGLVAGMALAAWSVPSRAADTKKLTEAQSLGVMLMANGAEIMIGQTMAARTTDPEVRTYAMRLLDDHLKANRDLLGIIEKTGTLAAESPARDQATTGAQKEIGQLWATQSGPALDKMFLNAAVEDHVNDLKMLDEQLIPSAQTPDIKAAYTAIRTTVAGHLQEACQLGTTRGLDAAGCKQEPTMPGTK